MKIALITGSSRGLGKSMASHLAKAGFRIVVTFKSEKEKVDALVEEIRTHGGDAIALSLDVSAVDTFDAFKISLREKIHTAWGATCIDVLVNNAGFGTVAPAAKTSVEQFDALMNVHVKGTFFLTQTLLDMICDGGNIVNVSSGLTRFSLPGFSVYAMMKGAVEVMTRYLAKELGERRIRVNTIAPGAIATDFGGGSVRDDKQINAFIASQTALGRVGEADDIGGALVAIVGDGSGWINGQRIEASGGMFL